MADPADDPIFDGTDGAHPAWWRGHLHTADQHCKLTNEILDGKDADGGTANEPWESTRRRLRELAHKPGLTFITADTMFVANVVTPLLYKGHLKELRAVTTPVGTAYRIIVSDQNAADDLKKIAYWRGVALQEAPVM